MQEKSSLDLILYTESNTPESVRTLEFRISVLDYLGLPSPADALTGAYGRSGRKTVGEIASSKVAGDALIPISATIPCKTFWGRTQLVLDGASSDHFTSVKAVDVLNFMRCDRNLKDEIQQCWNEITSVNCASAEERENERGFVDRGTARPDLIPFLLKCRPFRHIKSVVYPVIAHGRIISVGSHFGDFSPEVVSYKSLVGYDHEYVPKK